MEQGYRNVSLCSIARSLNFRVLRLHAITMTAGQCFIAPWIINVSLESFEY